MSKESYTPDISKHFGGWQIFAFYVLLFGLAGIYFGLLPLSDQVNAENVTWQIVVVIVALLLERQASILQIVRVLIKTLQTIDLPGEKWDLAVDVADEATAQIEKQNEGK